VRLSISLVTLALLCSPNGAADDAPPRPNILWITCEDMSPDLGCYGDLYAVSPNIDRFAAQGVRFTRVFTHAGVCAPSRSGIITCMYPTSIGTHHMRCPGVPPPHVKCFTEYLRAAGYYTTNNVKTDYQFAPPLTAWDESSRSADWRGRAPGQPFFAVINLTVTHESQVRKSAAEFEHLRRGLRQNQIHDPAKAVLPPYYPDTPVTRRDWANYHDNITFMDRQVAEILARLEADGLGEETIVWFWSDHGRGLPRAKRWLYDSGTRVPLLIRVPEKYRRLASPADPERLHPGAVNDDLIAFVDLGATVLSLAGVPVPGHFHGRPFLGPQSAPPRQYVFGARDRMDEAYDVIRSVRDQRYRYIRNYLPQLGYGQDIDYMNEMPTMREMRRLHSEGKLRGPEASYFLERKPVEELYDTLADPHEVHNLAADRAYGDVLERLRHAHIEWAAETKDTGLIPEPEIDELERPGGRWEQTAAPRFVLRDGKLEIACETPGASIACRVDGEERWRLYTGPLALAAGAKLHAKACRLGYHDSD